MRTSRSKLTAGAIVAGLAVVLVAVAAIVVVPSWMHADPQSPQIPQEPRAETTAQEGTTVRWRERLRVDSGPAVRGPWRMNDSVFRYVDDATVAITDAGVVAVAWVDQTRKDVLLQVYGADGEERFSRPVNVSRTPEVFSWLPRVVVSGDEAETVFVLWQEIVFSGGTHGGDAFFARSTNGGRGFDDPLNLSSTINGAGKGRLTEERWDNGSLDLARAADGTLYAAWTEYQGPLRVAWSRDRGRHFSEPTLVAGGRGELPARGPSLAAGDGDVVHLAWTVGQDPEADVHLAISPDAGRSFEVRGVVHATEGHSDAPKIAVDSQGSVHLVYAESPDGMFERYHIVYARSDDGGESFTPPERIPGPRPGTFESMAFPYLALDGDDALYLLWELYPDHERRPRALAHASSTDRGRSFAPASILPGGLARGQGYNGSQQGLLSDKLAVNGGGELAVVNSTFDRGDSSHVWLLRGRATGDD